MGGSGPDCIKKTDPSKGTGANAKRLQQGNSSNPETSSTKDTLTEETVKSKEKNDIFSKGEILPVQGEPDNIVDLYCKTQGKTSMNHCLGLVVAADGFEEKSYYFTDCLSCRVCWLD